MGFTTQVIGDLLGVAAWANTQHVVQILGAVTATLRRSGKRGPSKSPDFLGLTQSWQFVVLECKGTQSNLATLRGQLTTGLAQEAAVTFAKKSSLTESLAGGIFIPGHAAKEPATLTVRAPHPTVAHDLAGSSDDDIAAAICQSELATVLPLAGLVRTGAFLAGKTLADDGPVPDDCVEELARTAERETGDYVGVTRMWALPRDVMKTDEGVGGVAFARRFRSLGT